MPHTPRLAPLEGVRITLLHYSASPVVGGVETVLGAHASLLRRAGHEVQVLCGRGHTNEILPELADPTTPQATVVAALRPLLASQDAVFLHNVLTMPFHPGLTGALWVLGGELRGTGEADASTKPSPARWFAWVHDLCAANPDYADYPVPAETARLLASAHPNIQYIAVSEARSREFTALTGRPASVIPNGLDPAGFLNLPPALHSFCTGHRILERDAVLLHPTRLLPRKNVELGLHVLAAMREQGRDGALLVTGATDPHNAQNRAYADQLRTLRGKLGLEGHAFFLNDLFPVGPGELAGLYHLADALFFPSRQEGFGLPLLEAALHRLPIFCSSRVPGSDASGRNLTFMELDAPPAALAALCLERLQQDPAAQSRKEIIRRYSWDAIFQQHFTHLLHKSP